jgi:mono/diheme cytochrome c family protein
MITQTTPSLVRTMICRLPVILLTGWMCLALVTAIASGVEGNPEAGKKTYEQFCTPCHGATGKGDGPTGKYLTPKPADYSTAVPTHGEKWAEFYFKIIKEGGPSVGRSPLMAPWGKQLKDSEIWDVISYVETLVKANK